MNNLYNVYFLPLSTPIFNFIYKTITMLFSFCLNSNSHLSLLPALFVCCRNKSKLLKYSECQHSNFQWKHGAESCKLQKSSNLPSFYEYSQVNSSQKTKLSFLWKLKILLAASGLGNLLIFCHSAAPANLTSINPPTPSSRTSFAFSIIRIWFRKLYLRIKNK